MIVVTQALALNKHQHKLHPLYYGGNAFCTCHIGIIARHIVLITSYPEW